MVVPVYTFITRIAIVPHFNQQLVDLFHFSKCGWWIVISHCGFNFDFLDGWWNWMFCICLFTIYEALIFLLVFLFWFLSVLELSWIWVLCQIYELECFHRNLWDVFSFLLVCLLMRNPQFLIFFTLSDFIVSFFFFLHSKNSLSTPKSGNVYIIFFSKSMIVLPFTFQICNQFKIDS